MPTARSYVYVCCVGSKLFGSVPLFARRICLSADARFALVVPPPPQAARKIPAVASVIARNRKPKCIRVLPLRLILQPSSRARGESAPAAGLTPQPLRPYRILLWPTHKCQVASSLSLRTAVRECP